MKNSVEKKWAFVFYCFLKYELKIRGVYKYLNPFIWVDKIKNSTRKQDFEYNSRLESKNNHLNGKSNAMLWAKIDIAAYLAILVCIVFNIIGGRKMWYYILANNSYKIVFIIALILVSSCINHYILFRKKKYLAYFQEFERLDHQRKWLCALVCFIFFVLTIVYLFYSFKYQGLI